MKNNDSIDDMLTIFINGSIAAIALGLLIILLSVYEVF